MVILLINVAIITLLIKVAIVLFKVAIIPLLIEVVIVLIDVAIIALLIIEEITITIRMVMEMVIGTHDLVLRMTIYHLYQA